MYIQTLVQLASAMMGSESRSLPTFRFDCINQNIIKIDKIEMMIPHRVVSGLCWVIIFMTLPTSNPSARR